ncbi:hypothetical protein MJG53_005290 [Ovis ammon polii x Ovis aries]|uniref:Uncharacterized protein n=1 Tax=Ovis ammon polii x Ovis aries TaxID=2918886 RepID=A0ACB9VCP4_9CETA|nr:hypothetical protein MJG53_005290 [Ovis ammon polii x Ovis aries]
MEERVMDKTWRTEGTEVYILRTECMLGISALRMACCGPADTVMSASSTSNFPTGDWNSSQIRSPDRSELFLRLCISVMFFSSRSLSSLQQDSTSQWAAPSYLGKPVKTSHMWPPQAGEGRFYLQYPENFLVEAQSAFVKGNNNNGCPVELIAFRVPTPDALPFEYLDDVRLIKKNIRTQEKKTGNTHHTWYKVGLMYGSSPVTKFVIKVKNRMGFWSGTGHCIHAQAGTESPRKEDVELGVYHHMKFSHMDDGHHIPVSTAISGSIIDWDLSILHKEENGNMWTQAVVEGGSQCPVSDHRSSGIPREEL